MILSAPSPVAFDIFGFSVYWYGIILAFAIFCGAYVADNVYRRFYLQNNDMDLLLDSIPLLILVGFLGARLYYCIVNWSYYSTHLIEVFNARQGGLSIHGMLFACVVFLFFYTKFKKISFFDFCAPLCVGLPFAQFIGRWGNFFNSEAFGKPYDGFLKLYIAPEYRPEILSSFEYFHPTFLYESVLDFLIFVVLILSVRNKKNSSMYIVGVYLMLYSAVRIFVEFIRVDSVSFVFGVPIAVFVSAILLCVACVVILLAKKEKFR